MKVRKEMPRERGRIARKSDSLMAFYPAATQTGSQRNTVLRSRIWRQVNNGRVRYEFFEAIRIQVPLHQIDSFTSR